MKLTKYFMPLAALALLASCSNDKLDGPAVEGPVQSGGDIFMSINFSPLKSSGTRTATENVTSEVGKDYENKISTALIIFADKTSTNGSDSYSVMTSVYAGGTSDVKITQKSDGNYTVDFAMTRLALLEDIDKNGTGAAVGESGTDKTGGTDKVYSIFIIANAPYSFVDKFTPGADVQNTFELMADDDTYWKNDYFLMSNSSAKDYTIRKSDIALGTHTTIDNPYKLNETDAIPIQRAMSRFDIAAAEEYTSKTLNGLTVKFEAVAMVNMATKANLFKVTAFDANSLGTKTILFGNEYEQTNGQYNWVVSPEQTNWLSPLFTNLTKGTKNNVLSTYFENGAKYTSIASLVNDNNTDNDFTTPSDAKNGIADEYYIWRYAMENTNPYDPEGQVNGNTTGILFRATISGEGIADNKDEALYAYNSVILGNAKALYDYATATSESEGSATGMFEEIKHHYELAATAAAEANKKEASDGEWDFEQDGFTDPKGFKFDKDGNLVYPEGTDLDTYLPELDTYLVGNDFSIYRPTKVSDESADAKYAYYCYYVYWNRHNDNGQNTVQGVMEFATVRNNVYKLRVNSVARLGHPANPDDDPDPFDPEDPDEKDSFYCEITCTVLPWVVRVNDIDF